MIWMAYLHFIVLGLFLISFFGTIMTERDFFPMINLITILIIFPIVGTILICSLEMIFMVPGIVYILFFISTILLIINFYLKDWRHEKHE